MQLLQRLRCAPAGRAGAIETRTRRMIVVRLTHTLKILAEQIAQLETEIAQALRAPGRSDLPCLLPLARRGHLRRHPALGDR
jgi:hypothetical protein